MILKYWSSTRPINHPERARCREFTDGLPASGLHGTIAASLAEYVPVKDTYEATRVANEAAATAATEASTRVHTASAAFSSAIGTWTRKIDQANDVTDFAATALRPLLDGKTLAAFLAGTDWEKVDGMEPVFTYVGDHPSLVGTAESYQGVRDATSALRAALGDLDLALAARASAVLAFEGAAKSFDAAYGNLVTNLKRFDRTGLGSAVPRFRRKRKVQEEVPVPAAGTDPPAG